MMQPPDSPAEIIDAGADGEVLVQKNGRVLLVTINRPEVMNAVNLAVGAGIGEALELAEHDRDVLAVILTGAGTKSFCAGADLKAEARGEGVSSDSRVAAWGFAGFTKHHISKPVIAAVNGFALGGGTEIVLQSDLAIAVEHAKLGLPEVTRGVLAGAGGAFRIGRQVPHKLAMEMLLTGEPLTAQQALAVGLVNAVVAPGELLPAAFSLAARIAANAPLSVQATKRIARAMVGDRVPAEDSDWARTSAEEAKMRASADRQEGLRAFNEKRPPVWSGR